MGTLIAIFLGGLLVLGILFGNGRASRRIRGTLMFFVVFAIVFVVLMSLGLIK